MIIAPARSNEGSTEYAILNKERQSWYEINYNNICLQLLEDINGHRNEEIPMLKHNI